MTSSPFPTLTLPPKTLKTYNEFIARQIIPDPPDDLREIYERRVLTELSYLKAEEYDSPEHKTQLEKLSQEHVISESNPNEFKVPRNIQNPNFTKLMKLYDTITEIDSNDPDSPTKALHNINQIKQLLEQEIKTIPSTPIYQPHILTPQIDVRNCDTLELYFHYLLTQLFG